MMQPMKSTFLTTMRWAPPQRFHKANYKSFLTACYQCNHGNLTRLSL